MLKDDDIRCMGWDCTRKHECERYAQRHGGYVLYRTLNPEPSDICPYLEVTSDAG